MFNITVLVDLKSYGDYWLLPNSEAGADGKSTHAFLYQNIRKKLSAKNYKVLLAETNKNGGFISWANRQGALALAHFIGRSSHMPLEQLKSSAMQSVPVIDMLIKKNSPIYQKYRNLQKSLLFIQSLSVIPFELSCKITCESQSLEINKNYVLRPDEKIEIATLFN